jgi:hypothetical protein
MQNNLAIDLFCGVGGWTDGLLSEDYYVVGFDIEQHVYGENRYPAQLVIQDVLTLHGSQFKDASLIVASPPCQEYSYMAMPWSRAKQIERALMGKDEFPIGYKGSRTIEELNKLFNACFRIQKEACEAAGRHIPMVVENVKGAQKWVGKGRWNFGSFYLWGDVPALMPIADSLNAMKHAGTGSWDNYKKNGVTSPSWSQNGGNNGIKISSETGCRTAPGNGARFTSRDCGVEIGEGRKGAGAGAGAEWFDHNLCQLSSKSSARKMASAMIAKIPLPLSRHIAKTFKEPKSCPA